MFKFNLKDFKGMCVIFDVPYLKSALGYPVSFVISMWFKSYNTYERVIQVHVQSWNLELLAELQYTSDASTVCGHVPGPNTEI